MLAGRRQKHLPRAVAWVPRLSFGKFLHYVSKCVTMGKMNTARVNAYAKINLTLDITGAENGFHTLDSLVVSVSLYDRIVAKKRRDGLVSVRMHGMGGESIPPEENNAQRAGDAFVSRFKTNGADIAVYKNIPVGAGLGGSSADAAGVLNALAKLYGIKDGAALKELADGLGSDTGYMLTGGFARLRGRGELVQPLGEFPETYFLLICPKSGVSSAECYAVYDGLEKATRPRTERVLSMLETGNFEWAAKLFGNDLYPAAAGLNPDAERAFAQARSFSPSGAGMTGSGSASYACFTQPELCEWARSRYAGKFRVYCVKSVSGKKKSWRNPFALGEEERFQ